MDESQSSLPESETGYGEEDQEKVEEQDVQPEPVYRQLEPGDNSKFHDTIKEEDWDKLEKLLKRYRAYYYKKKRIQAREIEKEKLQQEEKQKAGKERKENEENDEDEEEEEKTRLERIRQRLPFIKSNKTSNSLRGQRTMTLAKKVLPEVVSKKLFVDPAEIVSPLLMVDSDGRTPLHLACIHEAPEVMLLDLLEAEKRASSMKDREGQVPLHCAIQTRQHDHVLERITKACPNALKTKDKEGRTPLGLATELAKKGRPGKKKKSFEALDSPFLWIYPTSKKETDWQFEQEVGWSKVNCLLREYIDRRKTVIPSEHGLILEALEAGADPNTIVRFVSTSDRYLMMDDELAGTAIGLCVERHYSVSTLEYLLENCREKTTVITDIVQKAIKAHYALGCHPLREGMAPFGKRVIDWIKRQKKREKRNNNKKQKETNDGSRKGESLKKVSFKGIGSMDEKDDDDDDDDDEKRKSWTGMKQTCKDWWEILNLLVFYCAYGRDFKTEVKPKTYHMLHAAVSAPMTPPSLVHLLLIIYPEAIYEQCPVFKVLPVHIVCTRWRYDVIYHDSDISSLDKVLEIFFESDPDQLYQRHKGSLPIHMALFGGQFWEFIKSLISVNNKLIGMRDAQCRLFPFQIAALPVRFRNIQLLMRWEFNPTVWRDMTVLEKKIEYEKVVEEQETRQLGTIFELLRQYPDAIQNKVLTKDSSAASQNIRSLSDLSIHYLSWMYSRNSEDEFRVRYDNLTALRNSILAARILPELQSWWDELQECIWNDSKGDTPRTDEYLLHSALYNPETPPIITELLIQLFPSSASKPLPGTTIYPIHIAAGTTSYQRQQFEIPYGMNNLILVAKAYKDAIRFKSNGRLPLHICLAKGKNWKEVRPLIMVDPSSLKVKDEQTGLVPFELSASFKLNAKENSWWYSTFTEKQMKTFSFSQLSTKEKAKALARARKKKELSQLTCIFELIRHRPSVLSMLYNSELMADNDDDSVTSLQSYFEDGYEAKGGIEQWETMDDYRLRQSQGSSRGLFSPMNSNMRSIALFYSNGDDTPALITPFNASVDKSLTSYLLEKSGSEIPNSPPKKSKRKKNNKGKKSPKPKFVRENTKMSIFDFTDLSFFDDDQSSESSKEENEGDSRGNKIPAKKLSKLKE